jgi:hypothetical protein
VFVRPAPVGWLLLVVCAWACQAPQIEAGTDRRAYVLGLGDTVGIVRLTVHNRSSRPIYLQTANGRLDLLVLIRVDSQGRRIVGLDPAGREMWSLYSYWESNPAPLMGMARLEPDSVFASTYMLPRGHYRTLVNFGERPEKLDEHGLWLDRFSIR